VHFSTGWHPVERVQEPYRGCTRFFSKINFLHGDQAKTYVFYEEFQGLSDAIIAFSVVVCGTGFFTRQTGILSLLSYICARAFSKN